MTVGQLLNELIAGDNYARGGHFEVIHLAPKSRLTPELREAVRYYKRFLLARLRDTAKSVAPNSRNPLVGDEVRAAIEAIEAEARAKGWPAELLWNAGFWDCPRGLAAVLEAETNS